MSIQPISCLDVAPTLPSLSEAEIRFAKIIAIRLAELWEDECTQQRKSTESPSFRTGIRSVATD